ncbi:oligopeptide transporter [Metarhizium album ARSEF 1941]|uniref:Oligopeptide transporter n=1 Tax=Metarhizium album (strain ARSEF 1941) TaxID=1081103 RepID=A0A0B2WU12_METAS|nr:oligopeptide transporter [Metarhizium album ARSEF 1941]KHN97548.1 oligopeptide transporter [Metarhizium album ARSEF 1941]
MDSTGDNLSEISRSKQTPPSAQEPRGWRSDSIEQTTEPGREKDTVGPDDGGRQGTESADPENVKAASTLDEAGGDYDVRKENHFGLVLCVFASVLQEIFYFKPQIILVSVVFLTVVGYVLALPFQLVPRLDGDGFAARACRFLNPADFNSKEHTFVVIMGSAGSTSAVATQILAAQRLYYGSSPGKGAAIFLVIASQFLSYGIAGLLRPVLVRPAKMLWPVNIPVNTLLETLHRDRGETRKRLRCFTAIFGGAFLWEAVPLWIAPIFQGIAIPCLARRDSLLFTNLFGGAQNNEGLGLLGLCFDWNYIAGLSSPLWYPLHTLVNSAVGYLLCVVLFMGVYYGNVWESINFPFLSQLLYHGSSNATNFVQYNLSAVLNPDRTINGTLAADQGLPYLSGSYVIRLITTNVGVTAAMVHLLLWNYDDLKDGWAFLRPSRLRSIFSVSTYLARPGHDSGSEAARRRRVIGDRETDPHYRLMMQNGYTEVPDWWYGLVLVLSLVIGIVTLYKVGSTLPWWAFIVANLFAALFILFFGAQMGLTGFQFDQQPVILMLGGYLLPRKPLANMYFAVFGFNGIQQGQWLLRDLKLAQFSHLPPRATFTAQMLGTVVGAVMDYVIMVSIVDNQAPALLSTNGTNVWSGQNVQAYSTLAVAWSMAKDMFSVGSRYQWVTLSYLLGFLAPVPFWLAWKSTRRAVFRAVDTSIVVWNCALLYVGVNSSLLMYFGLGIFAQWYLRRLHPAAFIKYNYLLSAALDGGTQVMVFLLSFAVLGAGGREYKFPTYALNNGGTNNNVNIDYCMFNGASAN